MGRVVLDSSYLIALFNSKDIHHDVAVSNISPNHIYCASVISITETLVRSEKNNKFERDLGIFKKLIEEILPIDEVVALYAAKLRAKSNLRTPDALISATASKINAPLWTLDKALSKAHLGSVLIQ